MGDMIESLESCLSNHECKERLKSCIADDSQVDFSGICRIHVTHRLFDWLMPPNQNGSETSTGTGFVLDTFASSNETTTYIVTAHHVVRHAVNIHVVFPSLLKAKQIPVRIVGVNVDMDVALLVASIGDAQIEPLKQGSSDSMRPPASVTAHGFALGDPHLQTTKGVISARVNVPTSRLQTDVAVYGGNSGGPVLDHNKRVVGIVQSGMTQAKNINYVVPIDEAVVICQRVRAKYERAARPDAPFVVDRTLSLNSTFARCNSVLSQDSLGMYCTGVDPRVEMPQTLAAAFENARGDAAATRLLEKMTEPRGAMTRPRWYRALQDAALQLQPNDLSQAKLAEVVDRLRNRNALRVGDIVTHITIGEKEFEIDMQQNCKFDFFPDARINFRSYFDRLDPGTSIVLNVRRGDDSSLRLTVDLQPVMQLYRELSADVDPVPYYVFAGVFVMTLTHNHVDAFPRFGLDSVFRRPDARYLSALIITAILPESPFKTDETIGVGDLVVGVNNYAVSTLDDLREAHERCSSHEHITLRVRDGNIASVTCPDLDKADDLIRREYGDKYVGMHTYNFVDTLAPLKTSPIDAKPENSAPSEMSSLAESALTESADDAQSNLSSNASSVPTHLILRELEQLKKVVTRKRAAKQQRDERRHDERRRDEPRLTPESSVVSSTAPTPYTPQAAR